MVYQLRKPDIGNASQVLGKSFIDYPVFKYIFPDVQTRKDKLFHVQAFLIKLAIHKGFVTAPSDKIEGVAVWVDSSNKQSPLMDGLRAGILSLFKAIGIKPFARLMKVGVKNEKTRKEILQGQECLIIESIGIDPQFQKQKFARKLIISGLSHADKEETPCYLETSNPINMGIYKKYGFHLVHEFEKCNIKTYCLYLGMR